jgi:hypothetical protein
MSDREWIDRVRSTRPEEFSSGDLGKLRDEARRSPEVRKAVADEVRLDQALHSSLGRTPLSTEQIVAHVTSAAAAGAAGSVGGSLISTLVGWLSMLAITGTAVVGGLMLLPEPGAGRPGEHASPGRGSLLDSSSVEIIDPIEDPRYVDDGTSPSDKLPSVAGSQDSDGTADPSPDAQKKLPISKSPGVKTPQEAANASQPPRGSTEN